MATIWLADQDCPVTGEIYGAGAGRFARIFIASRLGYVHESGGVTVEDVAEHWSQPLHRFGSSHTTKKQSLTP
jgi:hypothetical protein